MSQVLVDEAKKVTSPFSSRLPVAMVAPPPFDFVSVRAAFASGPVGDGASTYLFKAGATCMENG